MKKKSISSINPDAIPAELKALSQWVAWRQEPRDNRKMVKVPIDPKTARKASIINPITWGIFEQSLEYYKVIKEDVTMKYDPEDLKELELALERIGYTMEDIDLASLHDLEDIETRLDEVRGLLDELGLSSLQELEDLEASLERIQELQ